MSNAGGCKLNKSSYDFIHSNKRNRLRLERAIDLVSVFTNACPAQRLRAPEKF